MAPIQAFPNGAPFRVDQVMAAPMAMASLFLAQGLLAGIIHWSGSRNTAAPRARRHWWMAVALLLLLTAVFFTLASWGTSDIAKISYFVESAPERVPPEPLWRLLRPLLLVLPYRMAALHGLVAMGFAAAPIFLARAWGVPAWAGWWSLVITCSPLLRGFLQNAHSRQALSVLLLLPLFLHSAQLLRISRRWLGAGVVLSALSHNTFVLTLPISLSPWLLHIRGWRDSETKPSGLSTPKARWRERLLPQWPLLLAATVVLALFLLLAPLAWKQLLIYSKDPYFNTYPLRSVVSRLQWAMALGMVLTCLQRRLNPLQLLRCPLTQLLLGFGLAYIGIQQSIDRIWLPQVTSRLADGIAFFLLILYLAWLHRHRAHWYLLPVMYVTFQYWLEGRLLSSGELGCGLNDEFLCIPDRWPWQVHY